MDVKFIMDENPLKLDENLPLVNRDSGKNLGLGLDGDEASTSLSKTRTSSKKHYKQSKASTKGTSKNKDDASVGDKIVSVATPSMEEFATKKDFQSLNDKISSLSETILSLVPNINSQSSDKVIEAISGSESEEEGEVKDPRLDYFKEMAGTATTEGPKINEDIAKGTANLLSRGLSSSTREELYEKYETPENCPRLNVIKCNEVIFGNANKTTRLRDAKLQNIQKGLMKSLNVLTYSYDHIHRSENEDGLDRQD